MKPGEPRNSNDPDSITDMESITDAPSSIREPSALERQEAQTCLAALAANGYYVTAARRAKPPAPVPPGTKYCILSIDDDPALVEILKKKLHLDGFDVRTASNQAAIIAELQKAVPPDLIFLDVTLVGMNGFDILLKLRRQPGLGSVPVILLTAHDNYEHVLRGLASGADGYIPKPFRFEALTAAIKTVLGMR